MGFCGFGQLEPIKHYSSRCWNVYGFNHEYRNDNIFRKIWTIAILTEEYSATSSAMAKVFVEMNLIIFFILQCFCLMKEYAELLLADIISSPLRIQCQSKFILFSHHCRPKYVYMKMPSCETSNISFISTNRYARTSFQSDDTD